MAFEKVIQIATDLVLNAAAVLEHRAARMIGGLMALMVAVVLILTGVGFGLASAFLALKPALGASIAALLIGAGVMLLGFIALVAAKALNK